MIINSVLFIGKFITNILTVSIFAFNLTVNHNPVKYKLDFETQHHQFYITSDNLASTTDSLHDDSGYENRLTPDKNLLAIWTESYGHIQGEVNILEAAQDTIDLKEYDHVVEAGIEVQSGVIQFLDCPTSHLELEIKVNPGTYRVRVYSSNLETYDEEKQNDYYKIEIWPDKNMESKVLKKFIEKY